MDQCICHPAVHLLLADINHPVQRSQVVSGTMIQKLFRKIGDSSKLIYHYENKIEELKAHKQIKTASNYELSQKSILEFSEKIKNKKYSNLTLYNITSKWLDDYEYYMIEDKKRSPTSVSMCFC